MAEEKKKDEAKEPKVKLAKPPEPVVEPGKEPTPEAAAEAAPVQVPARKLVIVTDGTNVQIQFDQTTTLEKREIGRQLTRL